MAQSGPSDQIVINDHDEEATWHRKERPIAHEISTVDLHLIYGDTWLNRVHRIVFNLSRRSQRVITIEIKSRKNASDASDRDPTASVSRHFITSGDVALSRAFDRDPTTGVSRHFIRSGDVASSRAFDRDPTATT